VLLPFGIINDDDDDKLQCMLCVLIGSVVVRRGGAASRSRSSKVIEPRHCWNDGQARLLQHRVATSQPWAARPLGHTEYRNKQTVLLADRLLSVCP